MTDRPWGIFRYLGFLVAFAGLLYAASYLVLFALRSWVISGITGRFDPVGGDGFWLAVFLAVFSPIYLLVDRRIDRSRAETADPEDTEPERPEETTTHLSDS